MDKIRLLIVDDASLSRRLLLETLSSDTELEVVGTASSGSQAIAAIPRLRPNVVILDVVMPEMDGLETLVQIRRHHPYIQVIMFSALTERGAKVTLEALARGAADYVAKPSETAAYQECKLRVAAELIPKIKAVSQKTLSLRQPTTQSVPPQEAPLPLKRIDVVAVGVSTGGPAALETLLRELPADFPVPIVIVQHMPPTFTRLLAERLATKCPFSVREVADGDPLDDAKAWIAPGNYHVTLQRQGTTVRLRTDQLQPENGCRPAVDVLLRSVAATFGCNALAVILTGMGQDGLQGCQALRAAGGQVLVQDRATSVVWGMAGAVARAGLAHKVLPLPELAQEILYRAQVGRTGLETPLRNGP